MDEWDRLFGEGTSFPSFLENLDCHVHEWHARYEGIDVRNVWVPRERAGPSRVLAFVEAWCMDAVMNIPVLQRVCEIDSSLTLRLQPFHRHPTLLERFPGRGGLPRIPTVVFLDGPQVVSWSERNRCTASWLEKFLVGDPMPPLELDAGTPSSRLGAWMSRRFAAESAAHEGRLWVESLREWSSLLQQFSTVDRESRCAALPGTDAGG